MRQVYLDYSATTPVKEEVLHEMIPYFTEKFGNPSSLYTMGLESKEAVSYTHLSGYICFYCSVGELSAFRR